MKDRRRIGTIIAEFYSGLDGYTVTKLKRGTFLKCITPTGHTVILRADSGIVRRGSEEFVYSAETKRFTHLGTGQTLPLDVTGMESAYYMDHPDLAKQIDRAIAKYKELGLEIGCKMCDMQGNEFNFSAIPPDASESRW